MSQNLSWADIAGRKTHSSDSQRSTQIRSSTPASQATLPLVTSSNSLAVEPHTPARRVAFVSGHIDITQAQFLENYSAALEAAIHRGDAFVLSNALGVDTLALAYLRSHGVPASRITIYLHAPRPGREPIARQVPANNTRLGDEAEAKYTKEGYSVKVVDGYHTERDAAMTHDSDHDILWIRSEADTAALYGAKYRPGRVSGTQKNKDRRAVKERRSVPPSVT
ncbi:hypothetical protein EJ04DRAFT_21339 [Polyplosphaeria fusca]|uniref:Uncharacterized protein n=1 Tax=Polyplosphaeria fusca TaxID=682080 RepID=A0A9P4QU73_9PLEO|nr:hypothetical protein EJ04DRAFT_21339 [Polyplosphaeria fusca]